MADYTNLINAIQGVIRTNGNNEITGRLLQDTLLAMIDSLRKHKLFAGIATQTTIPPATDENVFYFASTEGTYADFDPAINLISGELAIISNEPTGWVKSRLFLLTGGGGVQLQSDWNQTDSNEPDYIKNKPTIDPQIQADWLQTVTTEKDYIKNKPSIPDTQIQSDWAQTLVAELDYIKNKPSIPNPQIQSDWSQTDSIQVDYIKNKPAIPAAQIQADWNQTNTSATDFIKNKPDIPTKVSDLNNDENFITDTDLSDHNNSSTAHAGIRGQISSLIASLGTIAFEDKANYEIVANKDFSIPATPQAGHYPTTSAIKTYVDSQIGGIPTQLFFYSFDYGQFTAGIPLISGITIGDELYNFADNKNYEWDGVAWVDVTSSLSKVPVDGSTALVQQKFVDGNFAGFPGTAIHEYYGGLSQWFPFPQVIAAPDNVTIGFNGAGQFQVKAGSITATEIESTIMALIAGAAKASDVATSLSNIYTKSESDAKFALITSLANFYTKTEADGKFALISSLASFYTKTEADAKFALISSLNNFYTKSESDAKYLQSITKQMIEDVLTGNITTHSHDVYLTAITKSMIEAQLTGLITTHSHNYQPTELGKGLSSNDFTNDHKALIDFQLGYTTVTTLANIPLTAQTVYANISSAQTLSVAGTPISGQPIHVFVKNTTSSAIAITIPNSGSYVSMSGTSKTLLANGRLEISIVHDSNENLYKISVMEAA